ncbi:MAG: universal stress protein [Nitrospira sp.]|nr:universal stress protein [Nitrospira sp.]
MTTTHTSAATLSFQRILHPSDFSEDSHTALLHAVKLAVALQGELTVMHVDPGVARKDFEDFPKVRPILEQWGLLPPGSARERVQDLGIAIRKSRALANNPTEGILQYMSAHPADLLVMATHQYDGLARWRHQSVAEPVARGTHSPALFVPSHVEGFIARDSGRLKLRRILIPVNADTHPQRAVDSAVQLATALGGDNQTGIVMHVGDDSALSRIRFPHRDGWLWHSMTCRGNLVDVILAMGADFDVDLIVMTTAGHDSLLDLMRGSITERVVRGARCPVLALPT